MIKASPRKIVHIRLFNIMRSKGLDYYSLAALSGVSWRTIYAIIYGECNPRIDTLLMIARALDVSLDSLYPLYEEQKKRALV